MTPGERVYRAVVDRYTVVHRYYGRRLDIVSIYYTCPIAISVQSSIIIVDTMRCIKIIILSGDSQEQRDREEGGGEGRRHDGRRFLYYILVHAIKDYVDCLTPDDPLYFRITARQA